MDRRGVLFLTSGARALGRYFLVALTGAAIFVGLFGAIGAIGFLSPVDTLWDRALTTLRAPPDRLVDFFIGTAALGAFSTLVFAMLVDSKDHGWFPWFFAACGWLRKASFWLAFAYIAAFGMVGGYLGRNVPPIEIASDKLFIPVTCVCLVVSLCFMTLRYRLAQAADKTLDIWMQCCGVASAAAFCLVGIFFGYVSRFAWYTAPVAAIGTALPVLVSAWWFGLRHDTPDTAVSPNATTLLGVRRFAGSASQVMRATEMRAGLIGAGLFEAAFGLALLYAVYWICRTFNTILTAYHGPFMSFLITAKGDVLFWSVLAVLALFWALSFLWSGVRQILLGIGAERPVIPEKHEPGRARKATRAEAAQSGFLEVE